MDVCSEDDQGELAERTDSSAIEQDLKFSALVVGIKMVQDVLRMVSNDQCHLHEHSTRGPARILHSNFRNPKYEKTLAWNDPSININWKIKKPILSDKDKNKNQVLKELFNF